MNLVLPSTIQMTNWKEYFKGQDFVSQVWMPDGEATFLKQVLLLILGVSMMGGYGNHMHGTTVVQKHQQFVKLP